MANTGNKLGKLSLVIVENFVESKLGEKFVKELRATTDEEIAITGAMKATADHLWEQWGDERLWNVIFNDLPNNNELLIALKKAVKTFYEHPTNTHFAGVLATILKEHQEFTQAAIQKAVGEYITSLTEELALADESFRENVRALSDLRMVEILRNVEQLLASQQRSVYQSSSNGRGSQIATGDHARNIQAQNYIENLNIDSPDDALSPEKIRQSISPSTDFTQRKRKIKETKLDSQRSVTISYSHKDSAFVDKIEKRLDESGIDTWRDIRDATAGRLEKVVDRAMRENPLVLLILSKNSVESDWVEHEAQAARKLEKELKQDVLCPIALDNAWKKSSWPAILREQIVKYNILDFSKWRDESTFEIMFNKLSEGISLFYGDEIG